ncbi:MAG: cation transporter [Nanoarchaeota archaeon]|nr:cation transporter [Nanoarchaeota archaeon]
MVLIQAANHNIHNKEVFQMKIITLKVKGMWCHDCEELIKNRLEHCVGIQNTKVSQDEGLARIFFDEKQIEEIIINEGYEV